MLKPSHPTLPLIFLLFALVTHNVSAQLVGDSYKQAQQTKTANFYYLYDGVAGFVGKNENGEVTGLLVDIMKSFEAYVEEKEGIKITSQYKFEADGSFQAFMDQVRNSSGGVFGLSNISIKEERKKVYSFSPPYLDNVSVLLSNAKAPTLENLEDISVAFKDMKAYTLPSSTYYERLTQIKRDHYPSMEIVEVSTGVQLMDQLIKDEQAFAILDLNYYLDVLQRKLPVKRHPVGDKKDDQVGVIMPKDCDWQPLLSEFLVEFRKSASYSEIISKNLGGSALRLLDSLKN